MKRSAPLPTVTKRIDTDTETDTDTGYPVSYGNVRKRTATKSHVDGKAKYRVLKVVAEACSRQSVPPLDERLKSMVASMVGNLLRATHPEDEIAHVAVELALKYDRFHGHEAMLGLQRVMELADEQKRVDQHNAFRESENGALDPRVAKLIGVPRRDTRKIPGNHRADGDPCRICQGPPGVHVRFTNIPELEREALDALERDRQARQPLRKLGLPARRPEKKGDETAQLFNRRPADTSRGVPHA